LPRPFGARNDGGGMAPRAACVVPSSQPAPAYSVVPWRGLFRRREGAPVLRHREVRLFSSSRGAQRRGDPSLPTPWETRHGLPRPFGARNDGALRASAPGNDQPGRYHPAADFCPKARPC
jgi:hypothetical protein